jgi:DNA-binding protein H-NS
MKTSQQIRQQIKKLEQQADALAQKEAADVRARIREAIAYYEFKPEDLFGVPAKTTRKSRAPKAAAPKATAPKVAVPVKGAVKRKKIAVKYRDTEGNTWTGRGSRPRWMVAALDQGKSIEDFAV